MHPAGREGTEQPWQQQQHPHHQGKLLSASWVLLGLPAACHNPGCAHKVPNKPGSYGHVVWLLLVLRVWWQPRKDMGEGTEAEVQQGGDFISFNHQKVAQ